MGPFDSIPRLKALGRDTLHQLLWLFNPLYGFHSAAIWGLFSMRTLFSSDFSFEGLRDHVTLQTSEPAADRLRHGAAAGSPRSPLARSTIPTPFEAQRFAAYSISDPED